MLLKVESRREKRGDGPGGIKAVAARVTRLLRGAAGGQQLLGEGLLLLQQLLREGERRLRDFLRRRQLRGRREGRHCDGRSGRKARGKRRRRLQKVLLHLGERGQ